MSFALNPSHLHLILAVVALLSSVLSLPNLDYYDDYEEQGRISLQNEYPIPNLVSEILYEEHDPNNDLMVRGMPSINPHHYLHHGRCKTVEHGPFDTPAPEGYEVFPRQYRNISCQRLDSESDHHRMTPYVICPTSSNGECTTVYKELQIFIKKRNGGSCWSPASSEYNIRVQTGCRCNWNNQYLHY